MTIKVKNGWSRQPHIAVDALSDFGRKVRTISAWSLAHPGVDAGGVGGLTAINGNANTAGRLGLGKTFNGSTQYFTGADSPRYAFGDNDFWMAATFRTTAASISMLVARSDGSGSNYYLSTDSTGKLRADVGAVVTSTSLWNDGLEHTVVWVRRGGTGEFWVDGKYDGGGSAPATITGTGKITLAKYGTASGFYLNGWMSAAAVGLGAPPKNVCAELSKNIFALLKNPSANIFPVVAGGATVIDLTAAALSFSAKQIATKADTIIACAVASLTFSAKSILNSLSNSMTSTTLSFSAKSPTLSTTVNVTAATLQFTAHSITLVGAIVIDLALAAFSFVAAAISPRVTINMTAAALAFSAKTALMSTAVGLTSAILSFSAKAITATGSAVSAIMRKIRVGLGMGVGL